MIVDKKFVYLLIIFLEKALIGRSCILKVMIIPNKIKEAIRNKKLVVFAGSGLSKRFTLPDWKQLVIDVINEIDDDKYKVLLPVLEVGVMQPKEVLSKFENEHNTIKNYIKRHFAIKDGDFSLHEKIIQISGKIITTNYDDAFELASKHKIIPANYTSKFNVSEINKTDDSYILKLHGSANEPDHCVIFEDQYAELYSGNAAAVEKLKSIFTEKVILFLGFSFSDPDINLIFDKLDLIFNNNNKHFILTPEPNKFSKFPFLETVPIDTHDDIMPFIDLCLLDINQSITNEPVKQNEVAVLKNQIPKIAILIPSPIDIQLDEELHKISECFDSVDVELFLGVLNIRTLETIEDYDLLVVGSTIYKSKIYIEDNNLKSALCTPSEICSCIPNDKIPIVFITNEKINIELSQPCINISTLKRQIIKRFVYKAFRENDLSFSNEEDIFTNTTKLFKGTCSKGQAVISPIYGNNKNLEIGKKSLTSVIGRIEEQASIASKLISIINSHKLLNIKASGGTGKTTIIKKVAYELYNRGYFKQGVAFKSCESVKTFSDFEETVVSGFGLTNIINFKDYLISNYTNKKIDLLVILDNFETVVNNLNKQDLIDAIDLLKFITDYANIVITSRERLGPNEDFEDVYSLTPLITDDALALFQNFYGKVNDDDEIKILRHDILEDLLNNNPLAIKLVTKSRPRFKHISELREQIKKHFFESINEDYTSVFKNNADLNIERTKSIYQSINYSYATLSNKEKIAFEILSLFPDGIGLSNFKKCFDKRNSSSNNISDLELRILKDKSLIEDFNGNLQLQPIIRRFADYQFSKRQPELRQKYCLDAYLFNCYILKIIEFVESKKSLSEAIRLYNSYKNNLLNVLNYLSDVEIDEKGRVKAKKYLLNYVNKICLLIVSEKQITEFFDKLISLRSFFKDIPHAETLIKVLGFYKKYYYQEFDFSYAQLTKLLSTQEMENRIFDTEDFIEYRYKSIISQIHSMEGYTIQKIKCLITNNDFSRYLDADIFYLGIIDAISRKEDGFYYYERELMQGRLDEKKLTKYIDSLHPEEHLEIIQCNYTLSKTKKNDLKTVQKLVVTNPYTKGLKQLMLAFISQNNNERVSYFKMAIENLFHIKYYYLEALYYYCLFLKNYDSVEYELKLQEGLNLSKKFHYQYLTFLFSNIANPQNTTYNFTYSYYPIQDLEKYVNKHNTNWEKEFRENDIDK